MLSDKELDRRLAEFEKEQRRRDEERMARELERELRGLMPRKSPQRRRITHPGDTRFRRGDVVPLEEIERENTRTLRVGGEPALWERVHNSPSVPRTVSAGVTGVVTGLAGTVIPIIGLTAGIVLQLVRPAELRRYEHIVDGITDGSAALVAQALFSGR